MSDDNAFPVISYVAFNENSSYDRGDVDSTSGLTKRELFAAMAMQGLVSDCAARQERNRYDIARDAVQYADALLVRLSEDAP